MDCPVKYNDDSESILVEGCAVKNLSILTLNLPIPELVITTRLSKESYSLTLSPKILTL